MYTTQSPTEIPSVVVAETPSTESTDISSIVPTETPSNTQTNMPPITLTKTHSKNPSMTSSKDFILYLYSYESHENWLLCDGSLLDPRDYPQLFSVIGYTFGAKTSTTEYVKSGTTYALLKRFSLPNAMDRVIEMNGNKYNIGDKIGNESIGLTVDNIPPHKHPISIPSGLTGSRTRQPSCVFITGSGGSRPPAPYYYACIYTVLSTEEFGDGSEFAVHQPTIFVGNLFIFAGY